jgi:hypothetical protein
LIRAALLIAVAVLPGGPSAYAAPSEPARRENLEARRVAEVRERLERRRALQRNLQVQLETLAAQIEALGARQEQTSAAVLSERQQARGLEQQLDRLVPRLLARTAEVQERRAQAAGALAALAKRSQNLHLDARIRARMLALSPVLLQRLGRLEHGAVSLRGRPDWMIARHAQIERGLPELISAQRRLEHERAQKRRLRQMASERLGEIKEEVRLLGEEQARLARRLPREEPALAGEPGADQRALPDPPSMRRAPPRVAAVDDGSADRTGRRAPGAGAWSRVVAPRALPEAPGPSAGVAVGELADTAWPTTPAYGRSQALRRGAAPAWPRASDDPISAPVALSGLVPPEGGLSGRRPGRAQAARSPPPLLPRWTARTAGRCLPTAAPS